MIDSERAPAMRVVAVVPAKDRADTVGATVLALAALDAVDEVLVVDDGSADATADAARRAGAWVLRLPQNLGKGGAVAAAVEATPETDVYLLVDADTGVSAGGAGALLVPVLSGDADMAVGVLPPAGGRGGFGSVRRLAAAGIRLGTGGFSAAAPLSGQRAVRGPLLRSLALAPRFGLEVGLTIDAVRAGARVVELPVDMDHRHTGRGLGGFAHRGRQAIEVARVLWSRLTSASTRVAAILVALVVTMAAVSWSATRAVPTSVAPTANAAKVLLVGVPGLSWGDLGTGAMPALDRLVAEGAVGAMNVRTLSDRPSVGEGYATLGAGSRVRASDAADGAVERGGRIVVPAAADLRSTAGAHVPTLPGTLGDALHAAGRRTAVVGNADLAPGLAGPAPAGHPNQARPAAAALMDRDGVVDGGSIDPAVLLAPQDAAPYRHAADDASVEAHTRDALAVADVVLVDPGDLDRSAAVSQIEAAGFYVDRSRAAALVGVDALIGRLAITLPPGTLLLVVSVTPPGQEWRLAPVVAAGAGVVPGSLYSPSTRRLGLVTLTDVAPTVLSALGVPVPDELPGRALRYTPRAAGSAGVARLARLDRDAAWRERVWLPVTVVFTFLQVVLWVLTAAAVAGRMPWVARSWFRAAAVAVAAFPLGALLLRAVPFAPRMGDLGVAVLVALDLSVVALAVRARRTAMAPLAWIFGATVALYVADVGTGARLQLAGILGYSPQSASRFFGIGNAAFGVLAAAAVLAAALHVGHAARRREAVVGSAALLGLVAYVDGAPFLGADVGGLLAAAVVFLLAVVALTGRRLTWRRAMLAGAAAAAVLGVATVVDLLRPAAARTHLGRLASDTLRNGDGGLRSVVARKVEVNLAGVGGSFWTALFMVVALALVAVVLRSSWARRLLPTGSAARVGAVAALAVGLLGFAVNDSGVIVVAMALVAVGPVLALLALAEPPGHPVLLEPANGPVSRVLG